jgi:hypothetical protein
MRGPSGEVLAKLWSAPNTALGLVYGLLGHLIGLARTGSRQPGPRIQLGHNAVEFLNNPGGGVGAIALGNVIVYCDDPYARGAEAYMAHEEAHTRQSEALGPFYLPSNLLGALAALVRDGHWHGPSNWNETGPQMTPPRPWPPRRRA